MRSSRFKTGPGWLRPIAGGSMVGIGYRMFRDFLTASASATATLAGDVRDVLGLDAACLCMCMIWPSHNSSLTLRYTFP